MVVICLGPVCVPLHLLLPFLVTLAHQRGYLRWFKKDWVTFAWWLALCKSLLGGAQLGATKPQGHTAQQGAARQQVGGGSGMASNAAVEKAEPQAGQCCHGPKKDS